MMEGSSARQNRDLGNISPLATMNRELKVSEVMNYFASNSDKVMPSLPPMKPKVFLYLVD